MVRVESVQTLLWLTLSRNGHWWQSGNMAETIARFGHQEPSFKQAAIDILKITYEKSPNLQGSKNWKNHYYDDMGWWAMAWVATYDLTDDVKYLNTASKSWCTEPT